MSKINLEDYYSPLKITPDIVREHALGQRDLELSEEDLLKIGDFLLGDDELNSVLFEAIYRALDELDENKLGV